MDLGLKSKLTNTSECSDLYKKVGDSIELSYMNMESQIHVGDPEFNHASFEKHTFKSTVLNKLTAPWSEIQSPIRISAFYV